MNIVSKYLKISILTGVALLSVACTSTVIDEYRQNETGMDIGDTVVILGRRQASDYETRAQFVECVGKRLGRGDDGIAVVPEQEFVDAMFPWFEPRTAPLRTRDFERMMAEDLFASRIDEFGVRYIVWLDGQTERSGGAGSLACVAGPGGAGCFGFGTWEDDSNFDARIWDVDEQHNAGTISTDATGQSYVPALVIPIPLIARVEANACSRLATQLKDFVLGS